MQRPPAVVHGTRPKVDMDIRLLDRNYLDDVYKVESESFDRPWSKENLSNEFDKTDSFIFGLFEDGMLIAYAGLSVIVDEGYLLNIAVLSEYRHKGYGKALLSVIMDLAKNRDLLFVTLEVRKSNENAINLYKKAGFEITGERKDYYSDPRENALLMTVFLR